MLWFGLWLLTAEFLFFQCETHLRADLAQPATKNKEILSG